MLNINTQTYFLLERACEHHCCDCPAHAQASMIQQRIDIVLTLFVASLTFPSIASRQCREVHSIYQKMLKGHTFKTFQSRPLSIDCIQACTSDDRCQSFNYVLANGTCEMNNRTENARPKDFVDDVERIYMVKSPRGIMFFNFSSLKLILLRGKCFYQTI